MTQTATRLRHTPYHHKPSILPSFFVGLMFCTTFYSLAAYAEDVVYVNDTLRVRLRDEPQNNAKSLRPLLVTGDKLEVLGQEDRYVHVRTEKGMEGWIKKNYISSTLPAAMRLKQLQASYKELKKKYKDLRAGGNPVEKDDSASLVNAQLQKQNDTLQKQMDELKKQQARLEEQLAGNSQQDELSKSLEKLHLENEALRTQLAEESQQTPPTAEHSPLSPAGYSWLYWLLAIIATAPAAFFAGSFWFRRKTMRRLGGLEI